MRLPVAIVSLGVLAAIGGLGSVYLGLPDVAATTPHWKITEWVLSTTMQNAVRRRAADLPVPDDLADPARIRAGAAAYDDMCAGCHAAPGRDAGVLAEGLLPRPPELADAAGMWGPAELFWITKHGVRMTGMPAFGPTHPDPDLWDIAAFLQQLPGMSPPVYRSLAEGDHEHEHSH